MSCSESEQGSYKFSVTNYRNIRKKMILAHNEMQDNIFKVASTLYEDIINKRIPKAKEKWDSPLTSRLKTLAARVGITETHMSNVADMIIDEIYRGKTGRKKALKPRKSAYPSIPVSKQDLTLHPCCESHLTFCSKTRTISWGVGENNHACDTARGTVIGKKFFSVLSKHTWARGEGGETLHQDEYGRAEFQCPNKINVYGTHKKAEDKRFKAMIKSYR